MGLLGSIFGKKTSTKELISKAKEFLIPQINCLEKTSENYVHLLGQRGIYYIYCLANNIADRSIKNNELIELLTATLGNDKAHTLFAIYSMTADNHDVHVKMINMLNPLAKSDFERGVSNSGGFLVKYYKYAQDELNKSFNEPYVQLSPEEAMQKANEVDDKFKRAFLFN